MRVLSVSPLVCLVLALPGFTQAFLSPSNQRNTLPKLHATKAGILGRFRKKREVEDQPVTPIAVGDRLKDVDVERLLVGEDAEISNEPVSILEVMGSGKAILLGMPGAFTPTCSQEHLPGYVQEAKQFAKLGYNTIAVVTTNDKFVNQEWMNAQGIADSSETIISMLSDGDGDFVKSLGLAEDMGFGAGVRSRRFALVANNGIVTNLVTDEGMNSCDVTSAKSILNVLTPEGGIPEEEDSSAVVGGVVAVAIALALAAQSFGGAGETFSLLKDM